MPLFRRVDGDPLPHLGLVRRMMPFLMPTRNESVVYFEQVLDLSRTLPFIDRWNASATHRITVFHVLLAAFSRVLVERPGLDRFVAGSHIYQRREPAISFAVKKRFEDEAPLSTVKLRVKRAERFEDLAARVASLVGGGRSDAEAPVDKEMKLLLRLPAWMLRFVVWLGRRLDAMNLLPGFMIEQDPLFASMFVANLGSLGIDRVFHHLYEHGTVSLFCAIGAVSKMVMVGEDDAPVVRSGVRLRYSFDERINDGHYCVASLELVKRLVEDPDQLLLDGR